MSEELQKALAEILNGVLTAKDFMLTELPDVVQQLLVWKLYQHAILFFVGTCLLVGTSITIVKVQKNSKNDGSFWGWIYKNDFEFPYFCACAFSLIISVLLVACNFAWLQVWLAPKVYLIEYAASLTK